MDKYIALFGALSLIFVVLVAVSLTVNFFLKGFYLYCYKLAKALQDGDKNAEFLLSDLLAECEEQKVWLSMIWQRPIATLLAATACALGFRLELGLSVSMGMAALTFLMFGFALPRWIPILPTFRLFSVAPATASGNSPSP